MISLIVYYINLFFMYYIFIYAIIFFISTITSIMDFDKFNERKRYMNNLSIENKNNYVPISILVPAYNEENTICDCIESLLNLKYSQYEIIIINDGSKDNTEKVILENFNLKRVIRPIRKVVKCKNQISIYEGLYKNKINITLINKENGGKADALNMGINASKYPLFVSLDADSILEQESLSNIIIPFIENEKTIAVGGNIKVSNEAIIEKGKFIKMLSPKKLIVICQIIEYYRVFLTTRVWFNKFNGNLIISGAFGLFKKNAVLNVGGYDTNSIGEDMELVVKLHSFYRKNQIKYNIQYAYNAICWSQVPETIKDLGGQRRRWSIGLITSIFQHKYIFLNPKYGVVGIFSFLYYLIYEMLSCIIDVVGFVIIIFSYFTGFINIEFFITFMIVYITYNVIISITSIILEKQVFNDTLNFKIICKLMLFSLIEGLGYRQICSWFRISGIIGYRKRKHQWAKITRKSQNKRKDHVNNKGINNINKKDISM